MFNKNNNENKIILIKKIRIYPTKEQAQQLDNDSFHCKILYNTYLSQRKEIYNYTGKSISLVEQRNQIIKLREDNSDYAKIYAKWLHAVCMDLENDYKGCVKKRSNSQKCKLPKYKDINYWYSLKTSRQYIKIRDNKIKLGFYEFKVNVSEIPDNYGEIWINKVRDKYIISITYEVEKINNNSNNVLAIDLGINKFITSINQDSEVLEIVNPRYDKYWNKKIDKVRSMRDKKKRGSKRYKILSKTLNRLYEKRRKQQEHFLHAVSKKIINDNKIIILGNLNQEQMVQKSKSKKLNRSIKENWGLGKFKTYLIYKAKLHNVELVFIDESYTSKTCNNCGLIHNMPLSNREYKCECGMILDRDINSAINIFNRYKYINKLNYKRINQLITLHFRFGKLIA
jgi:putative transposase